MSAKLWRPDDPWARGGRSGVRRRDVFVIVLTLTLVLAVLAFAAPALGKPLPGRFQWGTWYNGSGNGDDGYKAIATWPDGTVCAAGYVTSAGEALNVVVAKYSPGGGLRRWVHTWDNDAVHGDDMARAVSVDGRGNVFVAGESVGVGAVVDIVLLKYTAGGRRLWARRCTPAGSQGAHVTDMKLDGNGNVFIAGSVMRPGTTTDWVILKFDRSGHLKWTRWYVGPGASADSVSDLAVDGSGRVYVTGGSNQGATGWDATTGCWSASGARRWLRTIDHAGSTGDQAQAIALGGGGVYVAGYSGGGATEDDILVAKYSTAGSRKWVRYWDDPDHKRDATGDLAVDGAGNAYIAGFARTAAGDQAAVVVKYAPAGSRRWERFSGEAGADRVWEQVRFNGRTGRLVVAGDSDAGADPREIVLASYSSAGSRRWQRFYDGPADLDTSVGDLALWGAYFYFCGITDTVAEDLNALICKYSQ